MELDRPRICAPAQDVTATNKSKSAVIEIVDTEIVNDGPAGAGGHEGVQVDVFFEKRWNIALRLVGVVSSHDTFFRRGVVWLPDAREQQHPHIIQGERGEKYETSRLLELASFCIHIIDTGCLFPGTVQVDPQNLRFRAQLKIRIL